MAIVKMKRLRLLAMRSDQTGLLRRLRKLGCVEISQPRLSEEAPAFLSQPDGQALGAAAEEAALLEAALAVLKREAPVKEGFLQRRPMVDEGHFFDDAAYARALETARRINGAMGEVNAALAKQGKLETQRASLAPWMKLDVPLNTTELGSVAVLFGAIPKRMERLTFTDGLDEVTDLYEIVWAGEDRDLQYLMLLCHKSVLNDVQSGLLELGFTRVSMKDYEDTAARHDRELVARLAEAGEELDRSREIIRTCAQQRDELKMALDRAVQDMALEENRRRLMDTQAAFFLEGWFPAEKEEALTALLADYTAAYETADPAPEEYPEVPVTLKNNRVTRSMNVITEMYSMPAYDGIDPNPLMFPFFVLFFGMMMADMAYGLLMVLGTAVYLKVKRPKNRGFMEMIFWCGISTFIWGALTGGFFGDFIPKLLQVIDPSSTFEMPALFTPLTDTIAILIGSLALGVVQVLTGMIISVIKKIRDGDFIDALFDEITWWIIIAGLIMMIFGTACPGGVPVVLIAGFLMLAVGGTRKSKGIGKAASLVGLIYNGITGFFSDILSYMRLMALMLAGSVISQVFNTLGSVFGSVIAFVIISLIGNALNLALNLLGCYVHDLRLQCLEFFGRFYKEGGRPFRPLKIDATYVEIKKEEN